MIGWGKNRATQQPTGIGPQQFEKDHLGGCGCGRVSQTSSAKSSSVPDIDPIRGPIHRPAMTLRVDKGFQQHHAVPERCFPIPRQTPLTERENARPPIEQVPVGEVHHIMPIFLRPSRSTIVGTLCSAIRCAFSNTRRGKAVNAPYASLSTAACSPFLPGC